MLASWQLIVSASSVANTKGHAQITEGKRIHFARPHLVSVRRDELRQHIGDGAQQGGLQRRVEDWVARHFRSFPLLLLPTQRDFKLSYKKRKRRICP